MKNITIDPITQTQTPAPAPQSSEPRAPVAQTGKPKGKDTPAPAPFMPLIASLPQVAIMLNQSQSQVRRAERMGLMPPLVRLPTRGTGKARRLYWRTADIVEMVNRLTGQ